MGDLGPSTEARIAAAFSATCLITAEAAAQLIGLDVKSLRYLTDEGTIRAVRAAKARRYTERDVRAYLSDGPDVEPKWPARRAASVRLSQVTCFTERTDRKRGKPRA